MKRNTGNTIPIIIGVVALLLVASLFVVNRAIAPGSQTATTSATGADTEDSPLEKPIDTIVKDSDKATVDPALCKGRCAPNEECRKELGCAPCAPNTPPEYGNLCTCEPVYNCRLK